MKSRTHLVVSLLALMTANSVRAGVAIDPAKAKEIATQHACFACHGLDSKLVGPAWRDVAVRYSGRPEVAKQLVAHVQNGSSGVWGAVPMPPNRIGTDDARTVVQWILAGANEK
jgi:cytochrome c